MGRGLVPGPATLRSWLILAASLGLALAIYYGFLGSSWMEYVAEWTASWTSRALNLVGTSTRVNGTIMASDSFAVNIVAECTAVGPLVLFIGAVAAYPSSLRAKGIGALLGLVVLTLVNLVRIMSLFWIGSAYPEYLDMAHLLVWQTAIILLAIVLWLFWVERVAGAGNR
jgi:exosortase/archaeosortase family protein